MRSILTSENKNGPVVLVSLPMAYTFPLSYAYLASYLISRNEDVRMFYREGDIRTRMQEIMALNPLIVGFGSLFPDLKPIREMVGMLNDMGRKFPIVIGGQMVSPTPEFAVEITEADIGTIGEAEIILDQIVKTLRNDGDIFNVKGLVVRKDDIVVNTGQGEYIEDLSKLPSIHYELFPWQKWLHIGSFYGTSQWHWHPNDRVINVHGGRGCPWKCNFCYHHSKPRYRPMDLMMKEAQAALIKFDANMLYFSDDTTLCNVERVEELIEGVNGLDRPVSLHISTRFDVLSKIDDLLLKQLADAGCRVIGLGVESGSERILKIMGKSYTPEIVLDGFRRMSSVGIFATVSIMIGQFTETREDAEMSLKLLKDSLKIDPKIQYAFTITTPFPGSPLYDYVIEKNLISGPREFYDKYFGRGEGWAQIVNLSAMSENDVYEMMHIMENTFTQERLMRTG